ncbi:MAG: putative Ig domain-containing protein [Planctomycetes bacterium]|nr:putative Ig domain-containing protein [Planctomycetota bacterium]
MCINRIFKLAVLCLIIQFLSCVGTNSGFRIITKNLADAVVGVQYSEQIETSKADGRIGWQVLSGVLPDGLILGKFTGEISGIPTIDGQFEFELKAVNMLSEVARKRLRIIVINKIEITTANLPGAFIGENYQAKVEALGGFMPISWSIISGTLPDGIVLAPNTGEFSGIPTVKGDFTFDVQVEDNQNLTDSKSFTIEVTQLGEKWEKALANAPWEVRDDHATCVFDDKIWVLGGFHHVGINGLFYKNDVWYSSDGVNWTEATADAGWCKRFDHQAIAYDGKIWVMGGSYDNSSGYSYPRNDVWYSSDGVTWTQAISIAPWGERGSFQALVFDNKMWVISGAHQYFAYQDVWWSTDGITWTHAAIPPWTGRCGFGALVYDNKVWVFGGIALMGNLDDVWNTSDFVTWNKVTDHVPMGVRYDYSMTVFANRMWMFAGTAGGALSDAWYSTDGASWTLATDSVPWGPREEHTSIVFKDKLWIVAGSQSSTYYNDLWTTE